MPRTKGTGDAAVRRRKDAVLRIAAENAPCTIRQVYYRMLIERDPVTGELFLDGKGQNQYDKIKRDCGDLRESGEMPWGWIVDGTRMVQRLTTYRTVGEALLALRQRYLWDPWADFPTRIEVWCESDSIAGVVGPVTEDWRLPLYSARGQSSKTFLYNSAVDAAGHGKPVVVLYIGDFDVNGLTIRDTVKSALPRYGGMTDLDFRHVAVTPGQILAHGLISDAVKPPKNNHRSQATMQERYREVCESCGLPFANWQAESMSGNQMRDVLLDEIRSLVPAEWREGYEPLAERGDDYWDAWDTRDEEARDRLWRVARGSDLE